jgi:hypothetical protein
LQRFTSQAFRITYNHKLIRFKDYDKENLSLHFTSIFHRTSSIIASLMQFIPSRISRYLFSQVSIRSLQCGGRWKIGRKHP